jgi:hypothetical protein
MCNSSTRVSRGPCGLQVNTIAAALKPDFPQIRVSTMAYSFAQDPPRLTRPSPDVMVRLAPISQNQGLPLEHPQNAASLAQLRAWANVSQHLYIWGYDTNYASYPQPTPVWFALGPTIKTWVAHGVKGIFMEGSYGTSGGDMDALKDFVVGRLLWDPTLDPDALIDQFLGGYFGKAAAPHVRRYLDIFNASAYACGCRIGVHEYWSAPHLTPLAVIKGGAAFQAAVNATSARRPPSACAVALGALCGRNRSRAGADGCEFCAGQHSAALFAEGCTLSVVASFCHAPPALMLQAPAAQARVYNERLKVAQMSVYYVALIRWKELLAFATTQGLAWPFGNSFTAAWAEFASTWTRVGATMAMEGGFNLADIEKETQKAQKPWVAVTCPPTCPCGD